MTEDGTKKEEWHPSTVYQRITDALTRGHHKTVSALIFTVEMGKCGFDQVDLEGRLSNLPGESAARQEAIAALLKDKLVDKGVLTSPEESARFYDRKFNINPYTSPEQVRELPGSVVGYDSESQKPKVYLNPALESANPAHKAAVMTETIMGVGVVERNNEPMSVLDKRNILAQMLNMTDTLRLNEEQKRSLAERCKLLGEIADPEGFIEELTEPTPH